MLRMLPTLGDHALGGKIDNVIRPKFLDRLRDSIGIAVQIQLLEAKSYLPGRVILPEVREKSGVRLQRAAGAKDRGSGGQGIVRKAGSGKRVASNDKNFLGCLWGG